MSRPDNGSFDGIALYERLPFSWSPAPIGDAAELDLVNHDAARALQALAVFEEMPREMAVADAGHHHGNQELLHLQVKVDVLLSLVSRLLADQAGTPARHSMVLRAHSLEWTGPAQDGVKPGDTGYAVVYPNPMLPLPLRIPGRIASSVERSGARWLLTRFEQLSPAVSAGLEKLVFRRHRRQIAFTKGTGVFTETGFFKASKF
jgi:hypothetical protein